MKNNAPTRSWFWKYIFPVIYGLIVYLTIRLLLDSVTGMKFWERKRWRQTGLEIGYCIFISYIFVFIFRRLFRWFDTRWPNERYSNRRIVKELLYVFIVNLIFQNAFGNAGVAAKMLIREEKNAISPLKCPIEHARCVG